MSDKLPGCICVDGRFFDPDDATISVFDAGFLLGDGIFESLRASEGIPYLLDRHLVRLFSAAEELEFVNMPTHETITEQVYRTLQRSALMDAYVRVTVTRGSGAIGLAQPKNPPTIVIAALPAPARGGGAQGIHVTLLKQREESRPKVKSTSWQQAVLDRRCVGRRRADEGIYVSVGGYVLEGVTSNIFAVVKNRLLTPRVSEGLPGVTRARLLELARGAGLKVLETPLELDVLMSATEVFVTNAVQGLRSVCVIDGASVDAGDSDCMFSTLLELYEEDRGAMVGAVI